MTTWNSWTLRRAALVLASTGLAACNGGVAFEDLPTQYASTVCQPFADCAGETVARSSFGPGRCETFFEGSFRNGTMPQWMGALERGTTGYDEGAAAACLDAFADLGCDITIAASPPECQRIFVGTIEPGGACSLTEECAGDAYCDGASCPDSSGTCAARKENGAACDGDVECRAGLTCEDRTCAPPASRRDGPCGGPEGLNCPLDQICVGDTEESAGSCTPRSEVLTAAVGEVCEVEEGTALCQEGLSCALVGGGMTGLEWECKEGVGAGAPCNVAFPSMCPEDQYCDADPAMTGSFEGTCTALPTEGMACADSSEGSCASGLTCVRGETASTCVRPKDNGQPCSEGGECHSGLCEGGVCAAPELCAP
ncbi:MAG TPA: hypothetical protein RMH99_18460 [Sandaracinaceae bacterium LLY-WYZ-13_1]|nr:hypothetical protein [Sandaracinaceae bacterium LLY-WYZ-13_1]